MTFVTVRNMDQVALSEVVRVTANSEGVRIRTRDGEVHQVDQRAWEDAQRRDIRAAIPAPPGYFLLTFCSDMDGAGDYLEKEPIVGWVFDGNGKATPVTAEGVDEDERETLVPDGRVVNAHGSTDSLEAFAKLRGVAASREG